MVAAGRLHGLGFVAAENLGDILQQASVIVVNLALTVFLHLIGLESARLTRKGVTAATKRCNLGFSTINPVVQIVLLFVEDLLANVALRKRDLRHNF